MPGSVRDYNLHMGGADLSDMRTYIFLDERRTIRWNKKVLFICTSIMVIYPS